MSEPQPVIRTRFQTERLNAVPVTAEHAALMTPLLNDPSIHEFLNGGIETEHELRTRYRFLEGGRSRDGSQLWLTWILFLRSGEPIGFVEASVVEPEMFYLAYVLIPTYWRQGYGSEASRALIEHVFTSYEVERAVVEMDVPNRSSVALAESLGFTYIRTFEEPGARHPEHRYELTRAEWSAWNT